MKEFIGGWGLIIAGLSILGLLSLFERISRLRAQLKKPREELWKVPYTDHAKIIASEISELEGRWSKGTEGQAWKRVGFEREGALFTRVIATLKVFPGEGIIAVILGENGYYTVSIGYKLEAMEFGTQVTTILADIHQIPATWFAWTGIEGSGKLVIA